MPARTHDRFADVYQAPADPTPAPSGASGRSQSSGLRAIGRLIDRVEHPTLDWALRQPKLRAWMERQVGVSNTTLYRFASHEELRHLAQNGWRFDPTDPQNQTKFATPNLEAARAYGTRAEGRVIAIESRRALAYYKLSRFFSLPKWTRKMREHVVIIDGSERVRTVA